MWAYSPACHTNWTGKEAEEGGTGVFSPRTRAPHWILLSVWAISCLHLWEVPQGEKGSRHLRCCACSAHFLFIIQTTHSQELQRAGAGATKVKRKEEKKKNTTSVTWFIRLESCLQKYHFRHPKYCFSSLLTGSCCRVSNQFEIASLPTPLLLHCRWHKHHVISTECTCVAACRWM